ncbi:MAG: hypothetical protein ACRED2_04620 [Methylocella sp.]
MLSCLAAKLYWLARYVDLAGFLAQNIETSQPPRPARELFPDWHRIGMRAGYSTGFRATYGSAEEASVVDYTDLGAGQPLLEATTQEIFRTRLQ